MTESSRVISEQSDMIVVELLMVFKSITNWRTNYKSERLIYYKETDI